MTDRYSHFKKFILTSGCPCRTLSSKQAVNLDYLPYLRSALLKPLQSSGAEGASQSVELMDDYNLLKEDVDSMMEISTWGGSPDPYSKLDPKVREPVVNWLCALLHQPVWSGFVLLSMGVAIRFITAVSSTNTQYRILENNE